MVGPEPSKLMARVQIPAGALLDSHERESGVCGMVDLEGGRVESEREAEATPSPSGSSLGSQFPETEWSLDPVTARQVRSNQT